MSLPLFFADSPHEVGELARVLESGNGARFVELHLSREEMKHVAALRLRAGEKPINAARTLVRAWAETGNNTVKSEEIS